MKNRLSSIIAIILFIIVFSGCQSTEKSLSAAELLSLGEKNLLELDYEQALVHFLKVIEIDPKNPRGYTGAAEAYVELGDIDIAITILKKGMDESGDDTVITMVEELLMTPRRLSTTNESGETIVVLGRADIEGRKQGYCITNIFKQDTGELVYLAEGDYIDDNPVGMLKNWWFPDSNVNEQYGVDNGCGRGIGEYKNGARNGFNTVECYVGYSIPGIVDGEMIRFVDCIGERLIFTYRGNMVDDMKDDDSGNAYLMYIDTQNGDKMECVSKFKNDEMIGYVKMWRDGKSEYEGYWDINNSISL